MKAAGRWCTTACPRRSTGVLHLSRASIRTAAIHSNKGQLQREVALEDFKAGKVEVLVATEVAASLIQQRERLYDLAYTQLTSVIEKVLDPEQLLDDPDVGSPVEQVRRERVPQGVGRHLGGDPGPLGRGDLVAHERKKGADDERRARGAVETRVAG